MLHHHDIRYFDTMGIKDFLKKDKGTEFPMDAPPPYEPSTKSNDDLETYGHSTHVQTGTRDALPGADGKSTTDSENYKTLGRWRACVILITIEVGIGILSL
jgi:hypothetical protein